MKNLSKILSSLLCAGIVLCASTSTGQTKVIRVQGGQNARQAQVLPRDIDLDELTMAEMIASVPVDKKYTEKLQKYMKNEGSTYLLNTFKNKRGCTVETYRNKEVLLVTIPASSLFGPNETKLRPEAAQLLSPFERYLKQPDRFRVLLVMHTDNTGSDQYRDKLTEDRSTELFDWYEKRGVDTRYLFPYAMSDDLPLVENNSMENRERNRRLEVYIMPGKEFFNQSKKKR